MNELTTYLIYGPTKWLLLTFGLIGILSTQGCGISYDGSSNPIIWGQITHNGKPVKSGVIIFAPELTEAEKAKEKLNTDDSEKKDSMWAITGIRNDGSYRLTTNARGASMTTGWYRISVRPIEENAFALPNGEGGVIHGSMNRPSSPAKTDEQKPKVDRDADPRMDQQQVIQTPPTPPKIAKNEIPVAYHEPTNTKLKLWVQGQPMQIDINLLD